MPEQHQFDLRKMARWFIKEEVKTPLAFFFKVIPYMTAAWIAILYSPVPSDIKLTLVRFSAWVFVGLCGLVALFAFLRPRNLVYGETGHRAERKMELGTEKHVYSSDELTSLKHIQNPQQLPADASQEPQ
jgi:hypothetical protein